MTTKRVLSVWEEDKLHIPVAEVDPSNPSTRDIAMDLIDTFRSSNYLVGLAANQIGYDARMILLLNNPNAQSCYGDELIIVNPTIVDMSEKMRGGWESCGSVPRTIARVKSPIAVTIEGYSISGQDFRRSLTGFAARVAYHEVNHLDGKTILSEGRPVIHAGLRRIKKCIGDMNRSGEKLLEQSV
ncbi:MAG: peptide deformylase [bacterium]|nr:peptide deformylase [bacterium]